MQPIGRIIFEAADRSANYPLVWDDTLALALLPGGALTARQGGDAFSFHGTTPPPDYKDVPAMSFVDPRPALAALKASVDALPQASDQNATNAALKVQLGAIMTAVLQLPNPTAALAAIQKALTPPTGTGTGPIAVSAFRGGVFVPLFLQTDATGQPPTLTYPDGVTVTPVSPIWSVTS